MAPDDRPPRAIEINADDLPRITETLLGQVEGPTYHLDALTLARAWLSVAQASGRDADVPLLHRTVALEAHRDGVRLVATDRYVVLHAWVPSADNDLAEPPDLSELPESTWVAADPHGRAKGLMAHLLKIHSDEEAKPGIVTVDLGVRAPDEGPQATFEGLETVWVVLTYPNHERLRLETIQQDFVSWRHPLASFQPVRTTAIALNPDIVRRLAKLGPLHGNAALRWHFGGPDKVALIEIGAQGVEPGDVHVQGGVMPIRWGFDEIEEPDSDG